MSYECQLYRKLENNVVECTCCNHYCKIKNGKFGICGVRQNVDGKLYLNVYSKALGSNIDPIEKKPLYHFMPGQSIFSFGTAGCNFGCKFCQNWHMSTFRNESNPNKLGENLTPKEIIKICKENNINMIAATYNEPTIFFEYAIDVFRLAKQNGIKTVFVSNGYGSQLMRKELDGYLDAINVDLKSFSDDFYKKIVGAKLEPVLNNLKYLANKKNLWLEITTLIIPGYNDTKEELEKIASFIHNLSPDIPWHLSSFHPSYKMTDSSITISEKLLEAYNIGQSAGLKYVNIGNTYIEGTSSTYCPECGLKLIDRSGFYADVSGMKNGKCQGCGYEVAGVWE